MADLSTRELDNLEELYRKGGMLFGSPEHEDWLAEITDTFPRLLAMARRAAEQPRRKR